MSRSRPSILPTWFRLSTSSTNSPRSRSTARIISHLSKAWLGRSCQWAILQVLDRSNTLCDCIIGSRLWVSPGPWKDGHVRPLALRLSVLIFLQCYTVAKTMCPHFISTAWKGRKITQGTVQFATRNLTTSSTGIMDIKNNIEVDKYNWQMNVCPMFTWLIHFDSCRLRLSCQWDVHWQRST